MNTDDVKYMDANDVQYLDWQWVEEHPVRALDLMLKLHRENAALREDRERLNWMDEYDAEVQKYENPEDGSKRYEIWFFVDTDPSPVFSASTLRAAIDAARAEEGQP
jgi:hypothetical protein